MTPRVLSLRELNRATLARQMLLGREDLPVYDAVRRLVGLQAQVPVSMMSRAAGETKKPPKLAYPLGVFRVIISTWLR